MGCWAWQILNPIWMNVIHIVELHGSVFDLVLILVADIRSTGRRLSRSRLNLRKREFCLLFSICGLLFSIRCVFVWFLFTWALPRLGSSLLSSRVLRTILAPRVPSFTLGLDRLCDMITCAPITDCHEWCFNQLLPQWSTLCPLFTSLLHIQRRLMLACIVPSTVITLTIRTCPLL